MLLLLSLTAEYLHAGDVTGELEGWCGHTGCVRHARHGAGCRTCADYLFIHSSLSLAVTSSHGRAVWHSDIGPTHSLKRDPTMSCQQIIASNHFLGSLFSDKTRDCIQPPPSALMPAIKTESSLHSSLSQLHFYGRNFQRSSSLNLPRFFRHPPFGPGWWKSAAAARVSSVLGGEPRDRRAGRVIGFLCNWGTKWIWHLKFGTTWGLPGCRGLTCEDDEGAGTWGWQPGPTDVNGRDITHQPRATISKIFTPCLSHTQIL